MAFAENDTLRTRVVNALDTTLKTHFPLVAGCFLSL